jgi:hypothetical protein
MHFLTGRVVTPAATDVAERVERTIVRTGRAFASNRFVSLLTILSIALLLLPIVTNAVPPLGDYLLHLARVHIFYNLLHNTGFQQSFTYRLAIVPNLAIDAVVLGLMQVGIGIETAGKIFLAMVIIAMAAGTILLHYANFRRASFWPLLALPFFYHDMFCEGMVNYYFGLGIALIAAAFWEINKTRRPLRSIILLAVCSLALFFIHLLTLLMLFGLIASSELSELAVRGPVPLVPCRRPAWRLVAVIAVCGAPLLLLLVAPLTTQNDPPSLSAFTEQFTLHALKSRLVILRDFSWAYNDTLDHASLLVLVAVGVIAVVTRRLRLDRRRILPIVGLFCVFMIVPDFWFGTYYIPQRLPIVLLMLALASSDVVTSRGAERLVLAMVVAALNLIRGGMVEIAWQEANAGFKPLLEALETLPRGARVYAALAYREQGVEARSSMQSLPGIAVIRRDHYFAGVYALPAQNLVYRLPPYDKAPIVLLNHVGESSKWMQPGDPYSAPRLAFYDYALIINPSLWPSQPPPELVPLLRTERYVLFAIPHVSQQLPDR